MDSLPCPTEQVSFPIGDAELASSLLTEYFVDLGLRVSQARDMSGEAATTRDFESRKIRSFCIYPDPGGKWVTVLESGGLADPSIAAAVSLRLRRDTLFLGLHEASDAWGWQLYREGSLFEGLGFPPPAFAGLRMAEGIVRGKARAEANEFAWKLGILTPYLDYWELMDVAREQKRSSSIWIRASRAK
ncbi:MAG: hypothetical protein K8T20_02070 [Planctomycetes bacterium]|nr:hypothetical protein [Planctomycetota bacterium]